MEQVKICPKCGHINNPASFSCQSCNEDLFCVSITDATSDLKVESDIKPLKENSSQTSKDPFDFGSIFTCENNNNIKSETNGIESKKEAENNGCENSINIPNILYRYCTCGAANNKNSDVCQKCGSDIKNVAPMSSTAHAEIISKNNFDYLKKENSQDPSIADSSATPPNNHLLSDDNKSVNHMIYEKGSDLRLSEIKKIESIDGMFSFYPTETVTLCGRGSLSDEGIKGYLANKPYVSRDHLKIIKDGSNLFVEDVGSTNGTYLNGKKLIPGKRYALNVGDLLSLGKNLENLQDKVGLFKIY